MRKTRIATMVALLLTLTAPAGARDMMDPLATAKAFSAALAAADEATVKALLAPDVLIYESGGQESSREEYLSYHMKDDMAFLANAQVQVIERKHGTNDDLAWVATRSRITGKYKNEAFDLHSTKTLVLKREPSAWRIVHVQWSSRPAQPKVK